LEYYCAVVNAYQYYGSFGIYKECTIDRFWFIRNLFAKHWKHFWIIQLTDFFPLKTRPRNNVSFENFCIKKETKTIQVKFCQYIILNPKLFYNTIYTTYKTTSSYKWFIHANVIYTCSSHLFLNVYDFIFIPFNYRLRKRNFTRNSYITMTEQLHYCLLQ